MIYLFTPALRQTCNSCLQIPRFTKSFVSRKPIKIIQTCKMLLKQKLSVTFLYNEHYRFLFLISEDDSINFLSVSKNVNYLESALTPHTNLQLSSHILTQPIVGSTEAPSKVFLLFFLLPDWLKFNHLKSRLECGFSDIFSRHICSTVEETMGVTNNPASFGAKNVQKTTFEAAEMILGPWNQQQRPHKF